MENRLFLLLVNPAAGNQQYQKKLDKTSSFLNNSNVKFIQYFTDAEDCIKKLNVFLKANPNITDIVILGGDGTINICLNALPHFEYIISIISNGRGNDTVKNLYPNRSTQKQIENIIAGHIKLIDLGKCNERLFFNGVGIGIDGLVVDKLNSKNKKQKGLWTYLSVVLQLLPLPKSWHLEMEIDGRKIPSSIYSLTASKGTTFGGGFVTNPKARNDDSLIDISILKRINFFEKMMILPCIFFGKHGWSKKVEFLKCRNITIHSADKLKAHIDGEFFETRDFNIEVIPQKLNIRI